MTTLSSDRSRSSPRQTLGSLLRLSYQELVRQTFADEMMRDYPEIRAAHTPVLQPLYFHPPGLMATELAERAGITKQVMGRFIDDLESHGYVERMPHPSDRRARVVRLTDRGRSASRALRDAADKVESACREELGTERLATLRQLLDELSEVLQAADRES